MKSRGALRSFLAVALLALAAAGVIAVGEPARSTPGLVMVPDDSYIAS